eukprot:g7363.t1
MHSSGRLSRHERAEEKAGPVPRPRSAASVGTALVDEKEDHQSGVPDDNVRRPAVESLLHTQRIAEALFDVSRSSGGRGTGSSPFDLYAANMPRVEGRSPDDPSRAPDAFDVLAQVFKFQSDSVLNQRDNAISMLTSRLSRAVGNELENQVTQEDAGYVLEAFHGELLSNYTRWCGFLGVKAVSLHTLFAHCGDRTEDYAKATEGALMLLIWGEAGNLRFCPEFLCFLFHKMAETFRTVVEGKSRDITVPSYLEEVIIPAYDLLHEQLAKIGHGVIDHSEVKNYDDFNEIFWQENCLDLNVNTMFAGKTLKKKFKKTFVERQSWLVPIFHFWRVYALHIFGLHVMIVGARCQEDLGTCTDAAWGSTVITLYGCSLFRDLWDIKQAAYVVGGHRGPFGQLALNIARGGLKAVICLLLVVMYWSDSVFFSFTAAIFLLLAAASEAIMFTELWWGIASYGKWGTSTDRSCAGGGFAACCPSRIRQLGWSVIGSMCGINAVNLYTQVHSLPPISKRLAYIIFWAIVLLTKICFSYFVVIRKMTVATYTLYDADSTSYYFGWLGTLVDSHNYLYIVALWLGSGLIYFLDMQIWFVVWVNIAAACEGVRRRVGELNSGSHVVRGFNHLHKKFFDYLKQEMKTTTMHTRFAHIWNEIVDAMREEDILSETERRQLRYFLIQLRLPTVNPNARDENFAPEAQEGDWGPLFTLLPEFLMSGAVQRAVQSAKEFEKTIKDDLEQIKREEASAADASGTNMTRPSGVSLSDSQAKAEHLRAKLTESQAKFLKANGNDQVSSEMVRQLSASSFIILDALCRNEELSRALWNLHRALFASDVGQGGRGIGRAEGMIRSLFEDNKDKPAVKVVAAFSKGALLFSVQNFPGYVAAMTDLVKALNKHATTPNWNKDVASKLDKMVDALLALLECKTESIPGKSKAAKSFLRLLQNVRKGLENWKSSFAEAGGAAPGARTFKSTAKEFIRRTLVFLEAPGNSQPGLIKGAEARRRITFFVNSLFIEQPKKRRILEMPSLTTLTPYYNEDVVLSLESLRQETQDGVTVLEYLRSIYPDEFHNFVERMEEVSDSKMKKFLFEVDVMDPLFNIVLDTDLGADLSRESVIERVERAIITAVQQKRISDGLEAVDPKDIEEAAKAVDVDDMILQLQMWASNRGQTLSRTVRGIMYYSQAVRLLAVVENISEFQPQETGYMFGSSDRPESDEDEAEHRSKDIGDVVNAVRRRPHRQDHSGDADGGDGAAWRLNNLWKRQQGTPAATPTRADSGGRRIRSQTSFRHFFNRAKKSDLEATLNEELEELEEGGGAGAGTHRRAATSAERPPRLPPRTGRAAAHRPSPVRPQGVPADAPEGGIVDHADIKGGKFKAAVKRAMAAQRREKEAAARRGKQKRRQEQERGDFQGFIQVQDPALDKTCFEYGLTADLAEAKYRYVVSCQVFGKMQKSKKKADLAKAGHIKMLARMYPGLRISHVDEVDNKFYSVLSKNAGDGTDNMEEEYRVRLPGHILVGEGKPNNQNHALIFTRGEAIQAIDMNQDAALEDAIKIRQVMEEFNFAEGGQGRGRNIGRIVGFREHVFTHDVSAVANFFSLQELNFVSATQRALDNPLHVRFHYGHPDVFDRMSAITMGGISKACKGIHLSEDIFAGFNYVLRGGEATQSDYIQVSKGRDTGVSQVTGFTAKISMGNGMQARSREVGRLASQFDLFRLLSFYYSSVGGFMNQVLLMTAVFLYVYAKLYITFDPTFVDTVDDEVLNAISSQFLFQLGFLLILPIPLLLAVEQGVQRAVSTLVNILLRMAPFFFIFSAGTNAHYVNSAVMTGQAKYQATGRGFVIAHEPFVEMFPLYLLSHFNPAFELLVALLVYASFVTSGYFLETFSVFLLIIGLLWTPLLFNPNGLDFTYASQDFSGWLEWMNSPVDDPKKGWLSWYGRVLEETRSELPFGQKLQAIFRRSRLLILVYGFLTAIGEDYPGGIEDSDWPGSVVVGTAMLIIVGLLMGQSWIRAQCCPPKAKALKYGVQAARWARLSKVFILVGVIVGVIVLSTVGLLESARQFFYYILSFAILTVYASQVVVLFTENALRDVVLVNIAFKSLHFITGLVIMIPVLLLSFVPLFVDLQTRMLFNEDFSWRFYIAKIFARQNDRTKFKKNT